MAQALISVLIVAVILAVVWWIGSKLPFMGGFPMQILSIVLAIVWIVYALNAFGVLGGHAVVRI